MPGTDTSAGLQISLNAGGRRYDLVVPYGARVTDVLSVLGIASRANPHAIATPSGRVLGPHDAERLGVGENSHLSTQCLLRVEPPGSGRVRVHVRFLQIQQRRVQRRDPDSSFVDVPELRIGENRWFAWDEAVEVERTHDVGLGELTAGRSWSIEAGGGEDHDRERDGGPFDRL